MVLGGGTGSIPPAVRSPVAMPVLYRILGHLATDLTCHGLVSTVASSSYRRPRWIGHHRTPVSAFFKFIFSLSR